MAKATLLIVDDHLQDFDLIVDVLNQQDYLVKTATSGWGALTIVESSPPDLILLDIEMPGMSGYEVCTQLKNNHQTKEIPVIFVSVSDQLFDKVKAFSVGGADYISKPYQIEELLARVATHLTLKNMAKELKKKEQALQYETKKRQKYEEILTEITHTDYLTKVTNRRYFSELAEREIERAQQSKAPIAVILLDIDHFKNINVTHGQLRGDKVLLNLATLCQTKTRDGDILARFGGDEFIILMPDTQLPAAQKTAERLREVVFQSFMVTGRKNILITVSLGIAFWDGKGELTLENLLRQASQALELGKQGGGNRVVVWGNTQIR